MRPSYTIRNDFLVHREMARAIVEVTGATVTVDKYAMALLRVSTRATLSS
jgi:hypothetical protein